jgi:hypothetical protein
MSDRFCSHFCGSKHSGGGIPVSGMDHLDFKGTDAVWSSGDRIYCRLAIEIAEKQKKATR